MPAPPLIFDEATSRVRCCLGGETECLSHLATYPLNTKDDDAADADESELCGRVSTLRNKRR